LQPCGTKPQRRGARDGLVTSGRLVPASWELRSRRRAAERRLTDKAQAAVGLPCDPELGRCAESICEPHSAVAADRTPAAKNCAHSASSAATTSRRSVARKGDGPGGGGKRASVEERGVGRLRAYDVVPEHR
jgi:hypothetical protein